MKSYSEIAEETNTGIEDVRVAMIFATKCETPRSVEYNDFSNPPSDNLNENLSLIHI